MIVFAGYLLLLLLISSKPFSLILSIEILIKTQQLVTLKLFLYNLYCTIENDPLPLQKNIDRVYLVFSDLEISDAQEIIFQKNDRIQDIYVECYPNHLIVFIGLSSQSVSWCYCFPRIAIYMYPTVHVIQEEVRFTRTSNLFPLICNSP